MERLQGLAPVWRGFRSARSRRCAGVGCDASIEWTTIDSRLEAKLLCSAKMRSVVASVSVRCTGASSTWENARGRSIQAAAIERESSVIPVVREAGDTGMLRWEYESGIRGQELACIRLLDACRLFAIWR